MGAAYNPPDSLIETYPRSAAGDCMVRLEYQIQNWAAFWIKLQGVNLTPYSRLTFDIKADPQPEIPGQMKIELKRADATEISVAYVRDITIDWRSMSVPLSDFEPTGYTAPLSSFTQMEELVFTFESKFGSAGVVYLDNIAFRP